jgi:hypothetical protein
MIKLTLAAGLAAMLPKDDETQQRGRRTVTIEANSWSETVEQINRRFRRLGDHVFDDEGRLRPGLLIAVNDKVTSRRDGIPHIGPGDEVFLFTQIAGG